jgi:hypothetical protein
MSSLPQFRVSINGLQMHAVYNCNSAVSSISLQFCTTHSHHFLFSSESRLPVTFMVVTLTSMVHSLQTMHVSKDQIEDVIFGRDCFNYCSTGTELFATMDLIEPGMCLCFGTLHQSCIRTRASLGQIFIIPSSLLN